MAKVNMETTLGVAADQLWQLIGDFNALPDWHPGVEKSELHEEGQLRTLHLLGGGTITERLEKINEDERVYSYSMVHSSLPVSNCRATIRVKEGRSGEAVVEWSSEFEPKKTSEQEAVDAIQDIYQAGLDNLKKMFS